MSFFAFCGPAHCSFHLLASSAEEPRKDKMRRQGLPRNSHPWFRGSLWEGQAPTSPAPPDPAQGERPGGRTSSSTAQWSRQRRSRQTLLDAKLGVGTVEVSVRRSYRSWDRPPLRCICAARGGLGQGPDSLKSGGSGSLQVRASAVFTGLHTPGRNDTATPRPACLQPCRRDCVP